MIFEFYWSWYEDYRPYLFEHPSKNLKEFKQDCKKIMLETFEDYMNSLDECGWASLPDWMEFSLERFGNYGYRRIKPKRWGLWGGYIVGDKDDKKEMEEFPDVIFEKMCAFNKKTEKALDRWMREKNKDLASNSGKDKNDKARENQ